VQKNNMPQISSIGQYKSTKVPKLCRRKNYIRNKNFKFSSWNKISQN